MDEQITYLGRRLHMSTCRLSFEVPFTLIMCFHGEVNRSLFINFISVSFFQAFLLKKSRLGSGRRESGMTFFGCSV